MDRDVTMQNRGFDTLHVLRGLALSIVMQRSTELIWIKATSGGIAPDPDWCQLPNPVA